MSNLKILIACEFSGVVREAFRIKGYDVWSCDFLPSEIPGKDRWKRRSRTLPGIAKAMSEQWGNFIKNPQKSITDFMD